jgi:polysaccharide export outer membrane protein
MIRVSSLALLGLLVASGQPARAAAAEPYRIQPGDVLQVSVWREEALQGEVLVRPDGGISFPLVGDLSARDRSVEEVREEIAERLRRFLPDPEVTVAVRTIGGNRIFVLGKVNRPGDFALVRPIDVMQAIALAGGATPFAAVDDIVVLRREPAGGQTAIRFRLSEVERGRSLEQNILLRSGDTVVVP